MARGGTAKLRVVEKLVEAFGKDYIGENGNKYYVWADDGGEKVQIAIALTCPKNPIGEEVVNSTSAFGETPTPRQTQTEISAEETETLEALMKKLGL